MRYEGSDLIHEAILRLCQCYPPLSSEVGRCIAAFLTGERTDDEDSVWRPWSQTDCNSRLRLDEVWSVRVQESWLLACSQVNRQLRELLLPMLWRNVSLVTGGSVDRLNLIDLLTLHLPSKQRFIRTLRFGPLAFAADSLHHLGHPLVDVNTFFSELAGCKYQNQAQFESAVERMCEVFPSSLHTFHLDCGQLRLTPYAWECIARRCPLLTVVRLDAREEQEAFSANLIRKSVIDGVESPYPQYEEAVDKIRSVRATSIGWGEDCVPHFPDYLFRYSLPRHDYDWQEEAETTVGRSPAISRFLCENPTLMWIRLAAPPLTWQPSLLPVWARVLGLITAPISEGSVADDTHTSAFVVGSRDHIEDFGWEQYDIQYDAAAMALRPSLDRLAKVAIDTVLDLVWTEDVFAIWREPRQKQGLGEYVGPLFGHRDISDCSHVEVQRLQSIVTSWTSTQQHRAEERARGCPFGGIEWMEENTVESALEYAKIQRASAGIT